MISELLLLATAIAGPVRTDSPPPGLPACLAHATSTKEYLECERRFDGPPTSSPDPGSPGRNYPVTDLSTYESMWLRACPAALPGQPSAEDMDCASAHDCQNPALIRWALWRTRVRDPRGTPVKLAWAIDHVECRPPPSDIGVVRRQLGWMDVLTAVRRIGLPPNQVHAPHFTLVNLTTTFYTRPHSIDKTLDIIGYSVHVHLQPVTYTWHWGDGTSQTTDTPGRPYPATDITHTYLHATHPNQPLTLSVDTTYHGRYRVDTNTWTTLPEPITIPGPPTTLPIKQASAVLISNN
jgi:hypothetical protein